MKKTVFERFPKATLLVLLGAFVLTTIFISNTLAGSLFGLGKVVIYDANPIYGYRPQPLQQIARRQSSTVAINNLGLRAEQDWDRDAFSNKILFLGDSVTYGGSYIDNKELFSYWVGEQYPKFITGNAGVNGWGVNNVHAFIKEMQFLPAQVYVSVFPEGDFYRGLNRIGGQPFWTRKPKYALEELFQYLIYELQLRKNPGFNIATASEQEKALIVRIAARNLKDLDRFLKENNRDHLIYITPSRSGLLNKTSPDVFIKDALEKQGLHVIYLKDKLENIPSEEVNTYFHDEIHLSKAGHQKWATLICEDLHFILQQREKESLFVENNLKNANA